MIFTSLSTIVVSVGDTDTTQDVSINNHSNEPVKSFGNLLNLSEESSGNKLEEASHIERLAIEYKKSTCLYQKLFYRYYKDDKIIKSGVYNNTIESILLANRIRLIYTSLIHQLMKMYEIRKTAYRNANSIYLDNEIQVDIQIIIISRKRFNARTI